MEVDVAVIGGGFAGVYAAKSLRRHLRKRDDIRIALFSDQNYMVFQPMLAEVVGAELSPRHVVNPIRRLCKGVDVYRAAVQSLNPQNRSFQISAGDFTADQTVHYRHLVLAPGAEIDLSRVPGMPEHALLMQNVGDAMKLRATVIGRCEEANLIQDADKRRQLLSIVVVGGGYSGVETAGQILDLLKDVHRDYSNINESDFRVVLIHSGSHLLPTLNESLGRYAKKQLVKRGMEVILNSRARALTANKVYLDNGDVIESSTCISTVGNAPHRLLRGLEKQEGMPMERGRIRVNEFLQADSEHPDAFALWSAGDCAMVPMKGGGFCPPTAQFAMRQGLMLGRNLAAVLNEKPLKPFRFTGLGELATIGRRTAVASVFGMRFSGFFAWWMWRSIYLSKLPGFERKLRVLIDWTLDLFFPRDINLLNPRYTRLLKEVWLEKGDRLFNPGEPAFSFYVVQSGRMEVHDGDKLIKVIEHGGFFGERALLHDHTWHFTATATEPTRLLALDVAAFKPLAESSEVLNRLFSQSSIQYSSVDEINRMKERIPERARRLPVGDLMHSEVTILRRRNTIADTLSLLQSHRHSTYPVVDFEGRLVGALNRNDFYEYLKRPDVDPTQTLAELPLSRVPTISQYEPIETLIEVMVRNGSSKVFVLSKDQELRGIVTLVDLVRLIAEKR
ncbi:MAG: FAD-dependent oxidoreductase [Opitutales bacterium]|nr:FAD-dependent oxidoreductase [Opitutales bacterium]